MMARRAICAWHDPDGVSVGDIRKTALAERINVVRTQVPSQVTIKLVKV
jgi:hypothetical protein